MKTRMLLVITALVAFTAVALFFPITANASEPELVVGAEMLPLPNVSIDIGQAQNGEEASSTVQLLLLVAVLSLAPYLVVMMTSFTRIIIFLHFVRSALGTQQMPPNQVLIGLAIFLSLFIMNPVIETVIDTAWTPYTENRITQEQAIDNALIPIKTFMLKETRQDDLNLFIGLSGRTDITVDNIPMTVLIPAFLLSEIAIGFAFGFIIYMPFIVVDMVVSSTLMAMGMMMLPPAMISLPFKILIFIVLDGWSYTLEVIVRSFQ